MSVCNFKDLVCWQLADKLRGEVIAICERPAVVRDFKFCDSFRDAAGSVCRNISEGFTRGGSCEIVQFFTYALASLAEVQDHLIEAHTRKFIDKERFDTDWDLAEHAKATSRNFMKPHGERCRRVRTAKNKPPRDPTRRT